MGTFDKIGAVEVYEKGAYLAPGGSYELEVQNILLYDGRKGLAFIAELKVVSVTGDAAASQHPPGSKATWYQKMVDKDIALPAIKSFMIALLDVDMRDPEAKEEFNDTLGALLDELTAPLPPGADHPLKGKRVHCDTFTKLTLKKTEFTVHNWSPSESAE